MFSFLKDHPFSVEAFFKSSIVLTYAVPKQQVQPLIPECLELDTFDDKWAFIAVAMVQTRSLRPKGFPRILGNDFFLIGYRVFVKFIDQKGKRLRGLYILKSETDKKKMEFFGNIFTHYNYTTTDIQHTSQDGTISISSKRSDFFIRIDNAVGDDIPLPAGSPFIDWKEARKFAGPLPFTFTYDPEKKEVLVIEGVRENWKPAPLKIIEHRYSFIEGLKFTEVRLANAFIISDIPYYWKKGKKEPWSKREDDFRAH